jgi:DNA-binding NarL/FixJ family response regulator
MIKVLIVDDHPLMRDALVWTINEEADFQVIGEAANGQEALEKCFQLRPDLVMLDIYMPGMDGIEVIRQIRAAGLSPRLMILTSSTDKEKIVSAIRMGTDGFIPKNAPRAQIIEGNRVVAQGKRYIHPDIAFLLVDYLRFEESRPNQKLSHRECEVAELIRQGYSNREIADRLVISISTVRVHINNIMEKLKVTSRREIPHPEEELSGLHGVSQEQSL